MGAHANNPRSRARRAALQAIYQWQMTAEEPDIIAAQFRDDKSWKRIDEALFSALLNGVYVSIVALDEHLEPILDRPIAQVDPIERAAVCDIERGMYRKDSYV